MKDSLPNVVTPESTDTKQQTGRRAHKIRAYYEDRLQPEREGYDVLDWASSETQCQRFKALRDHVALEGVTLLDLGCGMGDLALYLQDQGIGVDYTGVDISAKMIEICRKRIPALRFVDADIFAGDKVPPGIFDVIFSSGMFSIDLGNNREFLSLAIERMLDMARECVVFNLLHVRSSMIGPYFLSEPDEIRELLAGPDREIRTFDDYLFNDFTVVCRRR